VEVLLLILLVQKEKNKKKKRKKWKIYVLYAELVKMNLIDKQKLIILLNIID